MNDPPITLGAFTTTFADDTSVAVTSKVSNKLHEALDNIQILTIQIRLNESKTLHITFTLRRRRRILS